jgi:hypothetical protein
MPDPLGPHCANQVERVECFQVTMVNGFARPDFHGWDWCGWMDQWAALRPGKQHSGLQDPFSAFYPIQKAMIEFSRKMYDVATATEEMNHV